jgi:predicted esterase
MHLRLLRSRVGATVCWAFLAGCQEPSGTAAGRAKAATSAALVGAAASGVAKPCASPSASPPPPPSAKPPLPAGLEQHALAQENVGFYGVLLPPGYEDASNQGKRFPLVVILHGSGSTELKHGRLAESFGREGLIYVLPRAPHVHEATVAESGEIGWSAWPTYPEVWGKRDSPQFPTREVDAIDPTRLYVDWIRDCVEDVRKRYRTDGGRVVVFGHSQGAAFAHYFAVAHPELVKAYFAYAGYYDKAPKGDVAALFKHHGITPFIAHYEADTTVEIKGARTLLDYFEQHAVRHTALILPEGGHRVSDRIKDEARQFIAAHTH